VTNTAAYLRRIAEAWKNLGGTNLAPQNEAIKLTGKAGVNVFKVRGADLAQTKELRITAPAGATVIVNIGGDNVRLASHELKLSGGIGPQNVVYNFYEATSLTLYQRYNPGGQCYP